MIPMPIFAKAPSKKIAEPPPPIQRGTYTLDEVAVLIGMSRNAVYTAAKKGELPVFRVGKRILMSRTAFARWLGEIK